MGPKKGRRERKIEVPTGSVPKFELGTQQQIFRGGESSGRQENVRRHSNSNLVRRRQEQRKHTRNRRQFQKKGPEPRKVRQKRRMEEKRDHYSSHNTRRGT